jgi:hypothetical protein
MLGSRRMIGTVLAAGDVRNRRLASCRSHPPGLAWTTQKWRAAEFPGSLRPFQSLYLCLAEESIFLLPKICFDGCDFLAGLVMIAVCCVDFQVRLFRLIGATSEY